MAIAARTTRQRFYNAEALSETSQLGAEPSNGSTPKPALRGEVTDIAAVWQGQTLQYQIIIDKIYAYYFCRQEKYVINFQQPH